MKANPQFELPGAGLGAVFNLSGERGNDPFRVERERWERSERERTAKEYAERMQKTLAECPGFIGSDPPESEQGKGRVVVEPGMVVVALPWLRRRFHVSENLGLSMDQGLCIEVIPRARKKAPGGRRRVSFDKPEQYKLAI